MGFQPAPNLLAVTGSVGTGEDSWGRSKTGEEF